VYLADEFYIAAGIAVPAAARYDGFAQYENGIGMTRSLLEDWARAKRGKVLSSLKLGSQGLARESAMANSGGAQPGTAMRSPVVRMTWICATLIAPVLERLSKNFGEHTGTTIDVVPITNTFFGPRVNVSGLLTAVDIESQIRGRYLGDLVVLPRYSLDYTGARFLDDVTPSEMQQRLGVPLAFASTLGEVLQFLPNGVSSDVTGAGVADTTNGKSWVDYGAPAAKGGAELASSVR
jgi:NifB/MoaA-like Fe-S oxidoreductase